MRLTRKTHVQSSPPTIVFRLSSFLNPGAIRASVLPKSIGPPHHHPLHTHTHIYLFDTLGSLLVFPFHLFFPLMSPREVVSSVPCVPVPVPVPVAESFTSLFFSPSRSHIRSYEISRLVRHCHCHCRLNLPDQMRATKRLSVYVYAFLVQTFIGDISLPRPRTRLSERKASFCLHLLTLQTRLYRPSARSI